MKNNPPTIANHSTRELLQQADMCVSCGMCLPHCPTYLLSQTESESPRGRISLIKGFLENEIPVDEVLMGHLDHCLLCRSCESICPARVPYANLMDSARARLNTSGRRGGLSSLLLFLVSHKKLLRKMMTVSSVLTPRKLLKRLSGRDSIFASYMSVASQSARTPKWRSFYSAADEAIYTVALFTGCLESYFNAETLRQTIRVLNKLGVNVHVPATQQCCGAMHLHAGQPETAKSFSQQNAEVFKKLGVDYVISLSTACTVTLIEQQAADNASEPIHYTDLVPFLELIHWHEEQALVNLSRSIHLHYPCSQRNVMKNTSETRLLLTRIPGLEINELAGNHCCGAAGLYTVQYPDWSDRLREQLLKQCDGHCQTIVTSNLGCILHMRQAKDMPDCEVIHPVNLVAQALGCQE